MVFIAISKADTKYGDGKEISKDTFETRHGVTLYFYDSDSVKAEFGKYGLIEAKEINEPSKSMGNMPSLRLWQIICQKENN